jgi:hypothetical protein
VPDRLVAERGDIALGKALIRGLQFLQAGDRGPGFAEPFDQARQARLDAVDVEGGNPHAALMPQSARRV